MPTIVKAAGSADLLALVPSMVGFTPKNSVVLVAFRGRQTAGAMRFDLPALASVSAEKRIITTMVGIFCKLRDVESIVSVIYSDGFFGAQIPEEAFARSLNHRLERSGFTIRESLCQAANGWASYYDDDVPLEGHPLREITDSPTLGRLPADARVVDEVVPLRVPDSAAPNRARVAKRAAFVQGLIERADTGDLARDSVLEGIADVPRFAEHALSLQLPDIEDQAALLIVLLQVPLVRDLVMLQWAFGWEVGDRFWLAEGTFEDSLLIMGDGPRPDTERIARGLSLLLAVTGLAADDRRPPLLCMLGWLSWSLGKSSRARVFVDEALTIRPDYSMARLLSTLFGSGCLPEWAFMHF